ncbi:hypothetical protein N7539_001759 [Penicillium diatomitis]|uniref:Uncharacterized protein n=1 Tax=Penicillium diatomitis TaxID=2819901 RepID=A0A9X0C017_9EURO|nr:uncharacterized protein N7539_001759 [Penicillium diatomitis]KAJ5493013.1 hypothetical protein N7539_001759 [Penicillium diatomitis]
MFGSLPRMQSLSPSAAGSEWEDPSLLRMTPGFFYDTFYSVVVIPSSFRSTFLMRAACPPIAPPPSHERLPLTRLGLIAVVILTRAPTVLFFPSETPVLTSLKICSRSSCSSSSSSSLLLIVG